MIYLRLLYQSTLSMAAIIVFSHSFLQEAIAETPKEVVAEHNNNGVHKIEKADLYGAIEDFNEAIRLEPDYELAYENRAIAKRKLGDNRGRLQITTRWCACNLTGTGDSSTEA